MSHWVNELLRQRPFAYAEIYCHTRLPWPAFAAPWGNMREGLDPAVATCCKNESNCSVFLPDGTWFTTWSQGSFEHALDERIVFATSTDQGRQWTAPRPIIQSTPDERMAYGAPFVVPATGRIYLFFFAGRQDVPLGRPEYDSGGVDFVYSDDAGVTWSARRRVVLPERDIDLFPGSFHGWINHPPQLMPTGEVLLPVSAAQFSALRRREWRLQPAEVRVIRCDNLLTEHDPNALRFTLLPDGPRGIRVESFRQRDNPVLRRHLAAFGGTLDVSGFNFQEMTVASLSDGRWLGVGRTFLGAPGFTVSMDRGHGWTPVEPLCTAPGGDPIKHPMTMCPIARTTDGRIVLLFTNNDGSDRGANHLWDGDGRTRNPQWIAVGREIPGETRNAGLLFGAPMILAEVDDSGETNLKTGISMPQFFERDGRYFVAYNINKEHLLLDEIPAPVLDALTP